GRHDHGSHVLPIAVHDDEVGFGTAQKIDIALRVDVHSRWLPGEIADARRPPAHHLFVRSDGQVSGTWLCEGDRNKRSNDEWGAHAPDANTPACRTKPRRWYGRQRIIAQIGTVPPGGTQ